MKKARPFCSWNKGKSCEVQCLWLHCPWTCFQPECLLQLVFIPPAAPSLPQLPSCPGSRGWNKQVASRNPSALQFHQRVWSPSRSARLVCMCVLCAHAHLCINWMFLWDPLLTFSSPFIFCKYNLFLSTHFLPKLFILLILPTPYFSSFLPFHSPSFRPGLFFLPQPAPTVSSIQQAFSECWAPVRILSQREIWQNLHPQVAQSSGTCGLCSALFSLHYLSIPPSR